MSSILMERGTEYGPIKVLTKIQEVTQDSTPSCEHSCEKQSCQQSCGSFMLINLVRSSDSCVRFDARFLTI